MTLTLCPTQLSQEHLEQFQRDGYLAFVDTLSPEEVAKVRSTLT